MALLAPGGRVLLLRNSVGPDAATWVEDLDPTSLDVLGRSPDLSLGPFWPGGMAVMDDGAVIVVQGEWIHRLRADLSVDVSRRLPVSAPHNSFVVLRDGSIALKDLQRPGGAPSTLSILDPVSLTDLVEPLTLPEGSVARLAADGDTVVIVGVSRLLRYTWNRAEARLDGHESLSYVTNRDQSFGWDPVVAAGAVWWLDNGDHSFQQGLTMLGNGVAEGPVRLWRAPLTAGAATSVEVCGLPRGAVTNPPLVDPTRELVVAYDSANGVASAFGLQSLEPKWTVELATAQHLVLYPDTGELLANDFDRDTGDAMVVVDIVTGNVTARAVVDSPAQSVVFGAPGYRRDAYYVSLTTIARVEFAD